jgi:HAD superfamily hydrolase (TIGR01509 family)
MHFQRTNPRPAAAIQAAVFDMDGLMLNTEELYDVVGSRLLGRHGLEFTPELKRLMMGRKAGEAFASLRAACGLRDSVAELIAESDRLMAEVLDSTNRLAPMPGLFELLDRLDALGIRKAIATSSRAAFASRVLGTFQLPPRFEFILSGDDVQKGKPDPEVYLLAAVLLDLPPAAIVVLEDSVFGSLAGVAAGAYTVAVPSQPRGPGDFDQVHLVVDTLAAPELYALFSQKNMDGETGAHRYRDQSGNRHRPT